MTSETDMERAAARTKSYTGTAVLAFFLYWILWPAGLIVNWVYLREAKRMERIAGESLPGQGCLAIMLWANIVLFTLSVCGAGIFFAFVILSSSTQ